MSHACQDSMQRIRRSTVLERRKSELSLILRHLMTQYFKNDSMHCLYICSFKVFNILFMRKVDFAKKKSSTTPYYSISALLSVKWSLSHFGKSAIQRVFFFSIASVCLHFRFFTNLVKPSASVERTLRLSCGFYLFIGRHASQLPIYHAVPSVP